MPNYEVPFTIKGSLCIEAASPEEARDMAEGVGWKLYDNRSDYLYVDGVDTVEWYVANHQTPPPVAEYYSSLDFEEPQDVGTPYGPDPDDPRLRAADQ